MPTRRAGPSPGLENRSSDVVPRPVAEGRWDGRVSSSSWARLRKTNCQIVSIRDQISEALSRDQVHLKLRICFEKSTELRSENELREVRVHIDAQSSPNGHFAFSQSGGSVFERRHNRANGLVKSPAFVGE